MANNHPLPTAFLSYAHMPNDEENDRIKLLRTKLAHEVEIVTGRGINIFIDKDIQPGQTWQETIAEKLDSGGLMIVLLTPKFFNSSECEDEVNRFLQIEAKLARRDLIIPIHYVALVQLNGNGFAI